MVGLWMAADWDNGRGRPLSQLRRPPQGLVFHGKLGSLKIIVEGGRCGKKWRVKVILA